MEFAPLGDSAVLIRFGDRIDETTYHRIVAISRYLADHRFTGMVEHVPAYTTIAVYYDPASVGPRGNPNAEAQSPYESACDALRHLLTQVPSDAIAETPVIEIPVCYGGDLGPDLARVAEHNSLAAEDVIRLHVEPVYRVFLIGFVPGFPYLGGMSDRLVTPRQATPRIAVPAGSVGVAGIQTGIYPIESPGGWQLIGRTPLSLFDPGRSPAALLNMGDRVRFLAISREEFDRLKQTAGSA